MNLFILADFDVNNPPLIGGVEKRISAIIKGLNDRSSEINYKIITSKNIDFNAISHDALVLTYTANNELLKEFSNHGKRVLNTVCSGMAPTEVPRDLFNDKNVKLRFLSHALKKAYFGKYDDNFENYVFGHGFHSTEYNLSSEGRDRRNIIWMASLGWGLNKGIQQFLQMAVNNKHYNFVAYAGKYTNADSRYLSEYLVNFANNVRNFQVYFDLKDENKKEEFKKAKLFCSFSRLIESFNVGNVEAIINNVPVATLNIPNNGGIDENLGKFNFKFGRDENLEEYLSYFDYEEYRDHAKKFSVNIEIEKIKQIYENF